MTVRFPSLALALADLGRPNAGGPVGATLVIAAEDAGFSRWNWRV